jgi:two-component system, LytTR family, response regulator
MIRTLIVDDEDIARQSLTTLLKPYQEVEIVAEASGVAAAKQMISLHHPDLVFLDVQLTDGTGFDLLAGLSEIRFRVIFVSAYDHYAINAFKFSAIDYLLKPLSPADLAQAMERILNSGHNQPARLKVLLGNRSGVEKIALPSSDEIVFVKIQEIIRCESDNNYTFFYLRSGERVLVSRTLKEFEELLEPFGFFRVHKSHLVNLQYIRKYKKGEGGMVTMDDGSQIEVSRRRKEDFLKALNA